MSIDKQELKPAGQVRQPVLTFEQVNTITAFQRLWAHMVHWTRSFILSSVYNLANLKPITDKLYSTPLDFYGIFASYYGTENSEHFVTLLSNFVMACIRMMEGLRNGDQALVDASARQWYDSADQIAAFLSSINVYWDETQWKNLLYQYIQMKIDEIMATIQGDYNREIALYEIMENLAIIMGSYMARGIIAVSQYQYMEK